MKSREQMLLRQFVLTNDADAFAALSNQYASLVVSVQPTKRLVRF